MKFRNNSLLTSLAATLALLASPAHAASVTYQFTGGSLTPTVTGLPAGVTASNFSLGKWSFANLSDNGGSGNSLRISGADLSTNSTGTAITNNEVLSFSLTIPTGVTLDLTSLTHDFTSGGLAGTEFLNARVFSSIDAFDDVVGDTIGVMGRVANGANSGTAVSISLATPDSNAINGANSNNGDFDSLTNQTITFYMPFVRLSGVAATDHVDIDNITLNFSQVPEPSSALLGGLGILALLRRRR